MRHLVGGDPGPEYNLARNWAHWGQRASGPAPGVIGVMPHHVFKVIQVPGPGTVLAISGNDSHAVRVRQRSTAGVIARPRSTAPLFAQLSINARALTPLATR